MSMFRSVVSRISEDGGEPERLLQVGNGLAVGSPRHGSGPPGGDGDRLLPQLPALGVMGQPLRLLGEAFGREPLDGLGDAGVQGAAGGAGPRTRLRG
jgi:hypothetical protein